jgi:hypothetical protein
MPSKMSLDVAPGFQGQFPHAIRYMPSIRNRFQCRHRCQYLFSIFRRSQIELEAEKAASMPMISVARCPMHI